MVGDQGLLRCHQACGQGSVAAAHYGTGDYHTTSRKKRACKQRAFVRKSDFYSI